VSVKGLIGQQRRESSGEREWIMFGIKSSSHQIQDRTHPGRGRGKGKEVKISFEQNKRWVHFLF